MNKDEDRVLDFKMNGKTSKWIPEQTIVTDIKQKLFWTRRVPKHDNRQKEIIIKWQPRNKKQPRPFYQSEKNSESRLG